MKRSAAAERADREHLKALLSKLTTSDLREFLGALRLDRKRGNANTRRFCDRRIRAITRELLTRSPWDHNAECVYCDEQGEHAPRCWWARGQRGKQ